MRSVGLQKLTAVLWLASVALVGCSPAKLMEEPENPATETVVPPDADRDHVADSKDRCPDSVPGQTILPDGCPVYDHPPGIFWISNVNFDSGSAALRPDAKAILQDLVEFVRRNQVDFEKNQATLKLVGHADACGSVEANLRLSNLRAIAVRDFLLGYGLKPALIAETSGVGSAQLQDESAVGEKCASETNRRVEFTNAR